MYANFPPNSTFDGIKETASSFDWRSTLDMKVALLEKDTKRSRTYRKKS